MNANLIKQVLRMLDERQLFWAKYEAKCKAGSAEYIDAHAINKTYETAAEMLDLAIKGNAELLANYDYFHES